MTEIYRAYEYFKQATPCFFSKNLYIGNDTCYLFLMNKTPVVMRW